MEVPLLRHSPWIDNGRAIATIAVIILHTAAPILYRYNEVYVEYWWVGNIFDSAVRFSVPLFFMISGTLLLSRDYNLNDFLLKRFWRIVPPFIFWSLIYIFFDAVVSDTDYTKLSFGKLIIRNLFQGSQFHLWFVYTLLGLYLFIPILRVWIKNSTKREIQYFIALWFVSTIYLIANWGNYLPQINLIHFSGFIGYFVLGYYLTYFHRNLKKVPIFLFLSGVIITIIGTFFLSQHENQFSSMFYNYLSPNVVASSVGIFLLIKKSSIKSKKLSYIICFISNYSYGIYLSHILVLRLLEKIGLNWNFSHPVISIPVVTIVSLLISSSIIFLIRRIKFGIYVSG